MNTEPSGTRPCSTVEWVPGSGRTSCSKSNCGKSYQHYDCKTCSGSLVDRTKCFARHGDPPKTDEQLCNERPFWTTPNREKFTRYCNNEDGWDAPIECHGCNDRPLNRKQCHHLKQPYRCEVQTTSTSGGGVEDCEMKRLVHECKIFCRDFPDVTAVESYDHHSKHKERLDGKRSCTFRGKCKCHILIRQ